MNNIKVKSLLSLTIPIFCELLLITIVGNIDTIMLGHYSDLAVGSIGGMSQVLNIQNTIFGFINLAISILCAQFIGAQDKNKLQQVITVGLVLNFIFAIVLGSIYLIAWKQILTLIQLPQQLISIGKNYFLLVGGLCIFQAFTLACGAVMKSHGNPKQMLFVNIGVNLLNIIGNGMFIFGWLGAPILGPDGVGIATVVSRAIGAVIAFKVMCRYCNFKFDIKILFKSPSKIIKDILSIGIPTASENLAWNMGQLIILSFVNTMGATMIATRTYLMLITNFIMTFSIALGHATAIQIGQLVGAKENHQAYKKCWKSLYLAIFLSFIVTAIIVFFKENIMHLFTRNLNILNFSLQVFPYMLLLEVGRVFNIVIINSLHAAGDIKYPMFIGIIFIFIVAVPFSYILGVKFGMGLIGIWIANSIDEWCRGIAMLLRWKSKKWQSKSFV